MSEGKISCIPCIIPNVPCIPWWFLIPRALRDGGHAYELFVHDKFCFAYSPGIVSLVKDVSIWNSKREERRTK